MTDLLIHAELVKLSRVLGAPEAAVQFLAGRDHRELRQLAERLSNALFDEHRVAFQRLADASRLLPASLVAKMSELVFGPMLSARVSGVMPPDRAVEIAAKLRTKFLAEVTIQLDPRSAAELLARMPVRIVVAVASLLLERGEYVTMGRFVNDLPDAAIRAVMEHLSDDAALVRIAAYVERRERLLELIEMLAPERLRRVVAAVAEGPEDVRVAGLAMLSRLSDAQQGRIGEIAIVLGPDVVRALVADAARANATNVLRNVLRHLSAESLHELHKIVPGFM